MKVVVSYINSIYDKRKTIELINDCSNVDGIHVDLMDGLYVENSNFAIEELPGLFSKITKPLDIHLMTEIPSKYFATLFSIHPDCIYIHPETEKEPIAVLESLESHNIEPGIVINPNQDIADFLPYFSKAKRVLLMSVMPGKGGQQFLENTVKRLQILKEYQSQYKFAIYVDGGINDETVKKVLDATGVVAGSFVCLNQDFATQVQKLKNNAN